jgi:PAS domain S-box-containing protein
MEAILEQGIRQACQEVAFTAMLVVEDDLVLYANSLFEQLTAVDGEWAVGHHLSDVLPDAWIAAVDQPNFFKDSAIDIHWHRPGEPEMHVLLRGKTIYWQGRKIGVLGAFDLTPVRQAEAALQQQNRLFESVIRAMPDPTLIMSPSMNVLMCNDAFCSKFGFQPYQVLGRPANFLFEGRTNFQTVLSMRQASRFSDTGSRTRLKNATGKILICEITHSEITDPGEDNLGWLFILKDVTLQAMMEEQLRQAQKLEALGEMAFSVAHDFNNILNVVQGYSEILIEDVEAEEVNDQILEKNLRGILRASESGLNITQQLLAFARKQELHPQKINLNVLIDRFRSVIETLVQRDHKISYELIEPIPEIEADPTGIEQVLLNLCANARDAIEGAGNIHIQTQIVRLDQASFPSARQQPYVLLRVSDSGTGIPYDVLPHIFEPFFTTKAEGKGTGMGLATVYGIVTQAKGFIRAIPNREQPGTAFEIFFPVAQAEA